MGRVAERPDEARSRPLDEPERFVAAAARGRIATGRDEQEGP